MAKHGRYEIQGQGTDKAGIMQWQIKAESEESRGEGTLNWETMGSPGGVAYRALNAILCVAKKFLSGPYLLLLDS